MATLPNSYRLDDPTQMSVGQLTAVPSSYNLDAPVPQSTPYTKPAKPPVQPNIETGVVTAPHPTPQLPPPPDLTGVSGPGAQTSVTQFGPDANLIGAQITPGQGVNRMDLANQYFDQFAQATAPQYAHDIDLATKAAAANGRLHSGMLTTDYGNLADRRTQALDLARQGLTTDALQGTIQDAINNRNELRTERGYQSGQDQQAIANAIQQYLLSLNIGNSQLNAGEAGNPSNILLGAGTSTQQQAGSTASDAANALAQWAYLQRMGAA